MTLIRLVPGCSFSYEFVELLISTVIKFYREVHD